MGLLEEETVKKSSVSSSTDLKPPKELPSVEEALEILTTAINALEHPGLDESEVPRLRSIIQGVRIYQGLLAEYVD